MSPLRSADYGLDVDRISPAETLPSALRRRLGGRYPVDPFGLDPQLCDLAYPVAGVVVRVRVEGGHHIPDRGGAVLVSNRGLGVFEPVGLALAVRRATGRRLRVVGAPALPFLGGALRRFGAVGASAEDTAACLRAGHVVAVPLRPTWLRYGAGAPPLPLMQVMLGSPVLPVAITPGGPFGTTLLPWRVRIGAPVVLSEPYPQGDPLGAAELGEAVRDAVAALLVGDAVTDLTRAEAESA